MARVGCGEERTASIETAGARDILKQLLRGCERVLIVGNTISPCLAK